MPKILVIDDDPNLVESLRLVLETRLYRVLSAGSSEEGMYSVELDRPDLILLDIMMPEGTEGFHFVWKLRSHRRRRRATDFTPACHRCSGCQLQSDILAAYSTIRCEEHEEAAVLKRSLDRALEERECENEKTGSGQTNESYFWGQDG